MNALFLLTSLLATAFSSPKYGALKEDLTFDMPNRFAHEIKEASLPMCTKDGFPRVFDRDVYFDGFADDLSDRGFDICFPEENEQIVPEKTSQKVHSKFFIYKRTKWRLLTLLGGLYYVVLIYHLSSKYHWIECEISVKREVEFETNRAILTLLERYKAETYPMIRVLLTEKMVSKDIIEQIIEFFGEIDFKSIKSNHPEEKLKQLQRYMRAILLVWVCFPNYAFLVRLGLIKLNPHDIPNKLIDLFFIPPRLSPTSTPHMR